jgi:serine/threonine protein phosphatase PrpC
MAKTWMTKDRTRGYRLQKSRLIQLRKTHTPSFRVELRLVVVEHGWRQLQNMSRLLNQSQRS